MCTSVSWDMKMRYRAHIRLCAVLLVALCAGASAGEQMVRERSEHYVIETNISREFARLARQHMESMFSAYRRALPRFDQPLEKKFRVKLFRSKAGYNSAVPDMVRGSSGVFVSQKRMLAAYLGDRVPESVFRTLYHEGFHQFMFQAISRDSPLWVNEGLATYFAEGTWNGNGFTLGQVPLKRLHVVRQAIRRNNIVPFSRLMRMDTDKWVRNIRINKSRASVQYSQVWSFIHFLLHASGSHHSSRLMGYLTAISRGRDHERAFQKHIGGDMQALTRSWKSYVFNLKPSAKSICKRNLRVLMKMALEIWDTPARVKNVAVLKRMLLKNNNLQWSATGPYGTPFGSQKRRQSAGLFTCPGDGAPPTRSYRMIRVNGRNPGLYCTHHPGIILRAYTKSKAGGDRVQVEERVRETLDSPVRRAVAAPRR